MAIFSKIGIVGAGISGIAAAKQLRKYDPIIFEATDSLGGVWKHCSYRSTKLQTPRCDYEFSDFPWTQRDNSSFPTYLEVLEYLHSYATHFGVVELIKFNSKVVEIRFVGNHANDPDDQVNSNGYGNLLNGQPVWEVAVQTSDSDTAEVVFLTLIIKSSSSNHRRKKNLIFLNLNLTLTFYFIIQNISFIC